MALGGGLYRRNLGGRGLAPMAMSSGGMRNGAGGAPTASAPSLPRQEGDATTGQDMAKLGGMLAMLQNKNNAPTRQMGPADQEIARMQAGGAPAVSSLGPGMTPDGYTHNPNSSPAAEGFQMIPQGMVGSPQGMATQTGENSFKLPGMGGGMPSLPGMGGGQGGQQGGGMQFDPQSMMQMFSQFFSRG